MLMKYWSNDTQVSKKHSLFFPHFILAVNIYSHLFHSTMMVQYMYCCALFFMYFLLFK